MNDMADTTCRRNSWLAALIVGLLVAAMLALVGHHGAIKSLFIGALVCVLLGFFLVWAFCSGSTQGVAEPAAPARPEPAPAPAPAAEAPKPAAAAQAGQGAATATATATPVMAKTPEPASEPAPAPEKPAAEKPAPKKTAPAKPAPAAKPAAARAKPAPAKKPAAKKAAPKAAATAPVANDRPGLALNAALAKSKEPVSKAGPELLSAPRGGKADDLKEIKGVGPKLEGLLNSVGVWHFDQIASWKAKDIAFVDDKMEGFKGRITRDEWVKQARVLARGGSTEFSARVSKGDVY